MRYSMKILCANLLDICKEILELNNSVRFVGIANDMGTVVASAYREGLNRLLTPEDSQQFAIESVLSALCKYHMTSAFEILPNKEEEHTKATSLSMYRKTIDYTKQKKKARPISQR